MDPPPTRHHRYVPFSDNPTFYQPQPYRLPPPPPLPTISHVMPAPPPVTHYLSLPLPPLPPPVQSHFTFRPSASKARSPHSSNFIPTNLVNHPRHPPPPPSPPRISSYHHNSRNTLQFDDNSRFSDPWPDLPLHFTGPPEHHNHHRPASTLRPQTGSYSNDFHRNLRFRDEHVDERFRDDVSPQLALWGRKEIISDAHNDVDGHRYSYTGRGRYERNSNKMDRDFVSADSQGGSDFSLKPSRNFELNMRNYELYEEDLRWRVSSFVTDREYGNNNGLSLPLRGERQELFTSGYEDVSKYKDIRVGEKRSVEFFNRSPGKKQLQKKSALERIQLGKTNNKRNKSYDRSYLSKSYHDESNSGGGSFKGKEKDVFSRMERKMEEERENSPVELDVSFKSNALVAKAIKAAPNPEVGSSRNLMHGYKKIRKLEFSESPGAKLSEHLDETDSSADYFDKDHRESAKNAISDKTDSLTRDSHHSASLDECQWSIEKSTGLHHSASPGQCKNSEEKVSVVRTESSLHGSDNPSDSDEDPGQLAKKIRISASDSLSAGDSQPCSSELAENTANKESPKLVESVQNVQDVSLDGTIDGTSRKRKRVSIPLPSKDDHEHTTLDNLYADCPPQAILLDEGLSNSPDSVNVSAVASKFILDVLPDERVESYSQKVSDLKNDNVDTKSSQLLLPQSSATISVLQNSGDAYTCEAADHAEISLRDCYSGLSFDKVVEHSCQDEPLPFKDGPGWAIDTVKGNASKENKIHDVQMEAYASRNEGCSTSSSEQILCRMSEKIDVADSMNANTEESSANQVSTSEANDVIEGSSNPVSSVGNSVLCLSTKLEDGPKENTTSIISPVFPEMALRENTDNCVTFINQKAPCGDDNCEINLPYMENIASLSENLSFHVDVSCVFSTNSADKLVSSIPEALFNNMISSLKDIPSNPLLDTQNCKSRQSDISNGHSGEEKIFSKSPVSGVETVRPPSLRSKADAKLSQALTVPVNSHEEFPLSQNKSKVIQTKSSLPDKPCVSNNRLTNSIHGVFPGRTSAKYSSIGKASAFNHVSRPRTWHRTGTASQSFSGTKSHVSSQTNSKKEIAIVQSSYIRKGNSLVRKPSPVGAVPQGLHASGPTLHRLAPAIDNLKKAKGSGNSVNVSGLLASATMEGFIAVPERPKTPPLSGPVKSLNCKPADRGDSTCSVADPFRNRCPGETFDPSNSPGNMDVAKCTEDGLKHSEDKECRAGSRSNLNGQSKSDEKNSGKKVTYVKRKYNQLVAASNSSYPCFPSSEKPQELLCEGYYKRRKNQLIRTSVEDNVKQRVVIPGKCLSSQRLETAKNTRNKSSRERQNGFAKKKFSLVWTLHGTLSSKKDGNSGHFRRIRPFLFPWKRATYWSNFKHSLSSTPNDNLASAISRKLLLSQKSDTIYKRSLSGFSLQRSKVLGFYGRSLKWSKSIEKNSRKTNEDAALAVVAAEKRTRQQNGERIFRIGSERYRMDPTGKALQRISDETPSYSEDQPEKNRKKTFVPRRLLIGNDAYVRIGNGNKLVRDPKERTRILASEKVRWSLHTARLRLARKKKYCQFFTKFGKCIKDDKRCPYIHDPTKIVVCTKFLNGCCLESNCKLTHKVIPERMQDCSYFLQGLCSNESCPYRHVNVNPKSPICEDFLRGYCADENECRKKHTYVCPVFEVTGDCQQGTNCKLHHPKIKKKRIKSKASSLQKNVRGRYFGAGPVDIANSGTAVPRMMIGECNDQIFSQDGKYADFISLADSDDAMEEEAVDLRVEPGCDNDREEPSDIQVEEDLDEFVKPIRIMKKKLVLEKIQVK